jgi:hypothetical protein
LKLADAKVKVLVDDNAKRLDRMRVVLENLQKTQGISTRAAAFPPAIPLKAAQKRDGR